MLNVLSGVGLLSVAYALRRGGWAALVVLWLLALVTNYTGNASNPCPQPCLAGVYQVPSIIPQGLGLTKVG